MLIPRPKSAIEELLPDHDPVLGALSSRHVAPPPVRNTLGAAALIVMGLGLAVLGAAEVIAGEGVTALLWFGPPLAVGAGLFLLFLHRDHPRLLAIYRDGFRHVRGQRTFVIRWTDVERARALTEDHRFRIDVTLTSGRELTLTEDIEGLETLSALFTKKR